MKKIHLRIGASPNNEVIIEDSGIDAHHLELFCDEYRNVFITDLSTKNGTFVNNQALNGFKLLKVGDDVRLGKTFILDWENLIFDSNFYKKTEVKVSLSKSEDAPTSASKSLSNEHKDSSKINRELYFIYGLIFLLIILMFYLL